MRMRMSITLGFVVSLLLFGCAVQQEVTFVKKGVTKQEFEQDKAVCYPNGKNYGRIKQEAAARGEVINSRQEGYISCMKAKGYEPAYFQ